MKATQTFRVIYRPRYVLAALTPLLLAAAPAPIHLPGLVEDPVLSVAAERHAYDILEDEQTATHKGLRVALEQSGASDPHVIPFAAVGDSKASLRKALLRFTEEKIVRHQITHYGVATVHEPDGQTAVVGLFSRKLVELPALPRRPSAQGIGLRGRSHVTGKVEAFITDPRGRVHRPKISSQADEFQMRLKFPHGAGRYTFELLAHTDRGPEVAALYSFYVGVAGADRKKGRPKMQLPDTRGTLEALVQRARRRAKLPTLTTHPALDQAARIHAKAVCKAMEAVHVLPEGTTPDERVAQFGYRGPVRENVAIAPNVLAAHENVLDSPSHLRNLMDEDVRFMGLAVATNSRRKSKCVVELFAKPPR